MSDDEIRQRLAQYRDQMRNGTYQRPQWTASDLREARQALEESIRRDPGLAEAHLNLGVVHVHQDRNDRAMSGTPRTTEI